MVRLDSVGVVDEIKMVSIHAPKYGATASPKSIITQELELCTNL